MHYKLNKHQVLQKSMTDFIHIHVRSPKRFFIFLIRRVIHFLGLKNPNLVIRTLPQGPLLPPIVFSISINYLNDGTVCALSKFADDSKLGGVLHTQMMVTSLGGAS